jgi:hypothetical protein
MIDTPIDEFVPVQQKLEAHQMYQTYQMICQVVNGKKILVNGFGSKIESCLSIEN